MQAWQPDRFLPGFESLELEFPDDYDGRALRDGGLRLLRARPAQARALAAAAPAPELLQEHRRVLPGDHALDRCDRRAGAARGTFDRRPGVLALRARRPAPRPGARAV